MALGGVKVIRALGSHYWYKLALEDVLWYAFKWWGHPIYVF